MTELCIRKDCPYVTEAEVGDMCECRAYCSARTVLREVFKHEDFRPGQLPVVMAALHKRDVLAKIATGGGKTLCFYLVPLAASPTAVGVIISPLKALMDQQVKQLSALGIMALQVSGNERLDEARAGLFRFVLLSPESAVSLPWRDIFGSPFFKQNLAVVAIDEAHCIPEWGCDFRKAFSKLGGLRALTNAPFMALTASAPPHIESQICRSLYLHNPVVISQPLDRNNIYFSASKSVGVKRDLGALAQILSSAVDSSSIPKTIVFSHTKDEVYKVFSFLKEAASCKHTVCMYHASQSEQTKSFVQSTFKLSNTEMRCLCASVAFGMGIDIPDVELVIVNGFPGTLSQLYQMFGRAGRNGCPARAHLLYTCTQKPSVEEVHLKSFACGTENCRRKELIASLGSEEVLATNPACCDVCTGGKIPTLRLDVLAASHSKRTYKAKPVRDIDRDMEQTLKEALLKEREKILEESVGLRILGRSFVFSEATVKDLCVKAKYIKSKEDLGNLLSLRPEYHDRVFNIVWSVVSQAPPPQRKRRII